MNTFKRLISHGRLWSQHIAQPRFDNPAEVVSWLGAVQAQEYLSALWAVGLRTREATEASVEQALADRTIVRTWPMRGTIHFVAASDVRWMLALLTPRVIARGAQRFRQLELDESVVARSKEVFANALQGGKQLTRSETYQLLEQAGISTAGQRGYHLLWRSAQEGLICFGAREGKQHTFALLDEWVPASKSLTRDESLAEIARRYFIGHGPATLQDFVWWSGLTMADARAGLGMVNSQLTRDTFDGKSYWASPDTPVVEARSPAAFLLPGFDEYLVGYRDRGAVLDPLHARQAVPGGGMLSATVVVDGQVTGVWKRTIKGDKVLIEMTPFSELDQAQTRAIAAAADSYSRFINLPVEV